MRRNCITIFVFVTLAATGCDAGRGEGGGGGGGGPPVLSDGGTPPPVTGVCPGVSAMSCATMLEIATPVSATGSTEGGSDSFGGSACGSRGGGGTGTNDLAFQFLAPAEGRYDITTEGSAFDTLLSVRTGCTEAELTCNDDIGQRQLQSKLTLDLAECESVLIIVDGYSADEVGEVRLRITARESACGDGMDNDGDGLSDCADPDCFSVECAGDEWDPAWQRFEWEVLELTNQRRAEGANCDTEGRFGPAPPLEMDAVIQVAARGHSLDMGQQSYFDHQSLDGRSFADRMTEAGFEGASPWAENIAAGQRSPAEVVAGWMESDGHCANIMNPSFRTLGVGYANVDESPFGHYWTQNFASSH